MAKKRTLVRGKNANLNKKHSGENCKLDKNLDVDNGD